MQVPVVRCESRGGIQSETGCLHENSKPGEEAPRERQLGPCASALGQTLPLEVKEHAAS